jgi:hypothetical protein
MVPLFFRAAFNPQGFRLPHCAFYGAFLYFDLPQAKLPSRPGIMLNSAHN